MDIKGKRFLVVGGAGLIGSHTVEELLKEDVKEVVVFDNFSRGRMENLEKVIGDKRLTISPHGGDITKPDILDHAMQGIDGVFHFAALWLLHCWDFPDSAFEVNIKGTFNVVQSMIRNKVKRLVYSSSASVYGDAVSEPMTEDHPYNNNNFYGATKIAGEHICRSLYHRHKGSPSGFDFVGLRYMNVYGPRQDYRGAYIAVMMKILDKLDKGEAPTVYGDGSQAYDFVAVRDCAKANVCAMKSSATDNFYNVGTGVKTSIRELTEIMLRLTKSNQKIHFEPQGQTFVKNRVGCPKRATRDLGFVAGIPLEDGLTDLIEWRATHKKEVLARQEAAGLK